MKVLTICALVRYIVLVFVVVFFMKKLFKNVLKKEFTLGIDNAPKNKRCQDCELYYI